MSNVSTCIVYDASTSLIIMTLRGTASAQDVMNFYQKVQRFNIKAENFDCFNSAKNWLVNQPSI
ncbi:hypothetical protein [Pseudoalteromonas arctica]|uniref:Uncharacterized protein n=1 Tax=Pseudoalteromonas arctica TaxID=394751 RepID=A0A7Y0DQK3_9GAMM|nr:hypothetical protein [Pseudoalteromonas arctica]NMM39822.1 hypothetical protein [Pseudoalteromonas arctica]